MATKPITKRQRYWLEHLNNAASRDGSLVAYAKAHELKPKDLRNNNPYLLVHWHMLNKQGAYSRAV